MKLVRASGLAALMILLVPGAASADDRFASPNGTGTNPCANPLDPCPIQTAVSMANSGDDVTLLGGVPPDPPYSTTTTLGLGVTNVTVHGSPGARPVLNVVPSEAGTGFFVDIGSVLRDVVVNANSTFIHSAVQTRGGVVERVNASENGPLSAACVIGSEGIIRDSVCRHTGSAGGNASAIGAFADVPATDVVTLRNVTAVSTTSNGIYVRSAGNLPGSIIVNATNVIAKGGVGAQDVRTEQPVAPATQQVNLDHSNYATESEAVAGDITDPGSGTNQTAAPVFVDATNGDFHQAPTSTGTLNLGTASGQLMGELDFEGQARTQGSAPDIGADEFSQPPPVLTGTTPASPANDNNPEVFGTAEAGSTVSLFDNGACTPPAAFTGPAALFASPGFTVTVSDNSTTIFSARSDLGTGAGPSACSTANVTYTEVTPPPFQPTPIIPQTSTQTGQRAAALKKCKKKRTNEARKRCRKRAQQLPV